MRGDTKKDETERWRRGYEQMKGDGQGRMSAETRGDEEGEKRKRERTEAAQDVERERERASARARREGGDVKKWKGRRRCACS